MCKQHSSNGPTSHLPGNKLVPESGTTCDKHEDRLAVKKTVGETDSLGCEYIYMCQECLDDLDNAPNPVGACDWCKHTSEVFSMRDFEEGSCGPVYQVCRPCISSYNKRMNEAYEEDLSWEPDDDIDWEPSSKDYMDFDDE